MKLFWNPETTPSECRLLLEELAGEYPVYCGAAVGDACDLRVDYQAGHAGVRVSRESGGFTIRCGSLSSLGRGLGAILGGKVREGEGVVENLPFDNFGVMLDMSRNAVMRPEHLRRWMRRLCLLGLNRLMLYTEDTYRLPEEPYFGYLRGAYSPEELRRIGGWGGLLGIEVGGCIQTLGHLEQVLKWPAYNAIRDTASVLRVDEEPTYGLIEKMVSQMAESLPGRTLHVGLDEAHDMGRGVFLDKHGYHPPFDLFIRHLWQVAGICTRHGITPQIWSDMVFRLGSATGDYYDRSSVIPPGVVESLPSGVGMVYWDYYGLTEEHYLYWIKRHKDLGLPLTVASSIWTWMAPWYDRGFTEATVRPCVAACRKEGVRDLVFTLWGDDGAYCEFDSALAGLAFAAECGWSGNDLEGRFEAVCGLPYAQAVLPCEMEMARPGRGIPLDQNGYLSDGIGPVIWDDPLLGILRKNRQELGYWQAFGSHQEMVFEKLDALPAHDGMIDTGHARSIADVLRRKVRLANAMESAYRSHDRVALCAAAEEIPNVIAAIDNLQASFRRQWLRRNRPNGLETIQIRLAGLAERYRELARRLEELPRDIAAAIPEWDESPGVPVRGLVQWRRIASPGIL